ncbi:MAG: hypothetical protein HY851_02545 [candidate division Zixibacteria bacterium]|nr:hypothetical protein [candidate division Zixibacteria bacterium]
MKINPLAIQTYQSPTTARPQTDSKPAARPGNTERVVITPQSEAQKSALAVKAAPADYGSLLTEPERRAMEALFARFKETGKPAGAGSTSESERGLGQIVDIKV